MPVNTTQPTSQSVDTYLAGIGNEPRRVDAAALIGLIASVTKSEPVMWGSSIVGFGTHHYVYETGREGDTVAVGIAARKEALVLYGLSQDQENKDTLANQLGSYTKGKGCIYIKKLSDVNLDILRQMVASSFQHRNNAPG